MEGALRIMFFSTGIIFLGIATALENIQEFLTIDISQVPSEELKLIQFGLYGIFIGFMVLTAMFGGDA